MGAVIISLFERMGNSVVDVFWLGVWGYLGWRVYVAFKRPDEHKRLVELDKERWGKLMTAFGVWANRLMTKKAGKA